VSFDRCLPCHLAVRYVPSAVDMIVDYSLGALVESECNNALRHLCRRLYSEVHHPSTACTVILWGRCCFRFSDCHHPYVKSLLCGQLVPSASYGIQLPW
jgi:hypothetical protein